MGRGEVQTLNELFGRAIQRRAGEVVMRYKRDRSWRDLTGAEVDERVRQVALGLHQLGVRPGDRVALIAESAPEWSIVDYGILGCGAINVPIYPTQALDQVAFILRNSGARVLFVSNVKLLRRLAPALEALGRDRAPQLILFETPREEEVRGALSLSALERAGAAERTRHPDLYRQLAAAPQPDDLATIIYTSGTTGEPKGVCLTHRNLVFDAISTGEVIGPRPDDLALSFLPLSHVFERTVHYIFMHFGITVCFARGVETVAEDIKEIRPTIVTAVPRLFEKIYATINKRAAEAPAWQQKIFHRAIEVGREVARRRDRGERIPLGLALEHRFADRMVFRKWRAAVGGRIRFFVSGGAALPTDLAYLFAGAGLLILQGYGLTETSPIVSANQVDANRIGTVGRAIPGVRVRLAEDGELLVQGENVMQGYYLLPEETERVLQRDHDGVWFYTGDIGTIDEDGYISLTDRKKDLFKTSLGKYIAPQPIENQIRALPLVEQVVVIGNQRKYPVALIVPNYDALQAYADSLHLGLRNRGEMARHPRIIEYFRKKVDEVTPNLAPHERIKRIALVEQEFSVEGGELTPTLKIRRKFVEEKYRAVIDALYPKTELELS
jgi:long-chain acyl-CoA synthetase